MSKQAKWLVCMMLATPAVNANAETRTWINNVGGSWTNTANWQDGFRPVDGDVADLSAATGVIDLETGINVGEIHYNPAVISGATNTLTILSDEQAPASRTITFTGTLTNRVQVGEGAELSVEADMLVNGNLVKDGYGTLVAGRRLYATTTATLCEWWIEQGRLVNDGTITAPRFRVRVGTVEPEAGEPPELVLRDGSSYTTSSYLQNSDVIFGGNRLAASGLGSRGIVTQEGGVLDLTTNLTSGAFLNGYAAGGYSVYNLAGGEVNLRGKSLYVGFNGTGTVNQTGGRMTASTLFFSTSATGRGIYNLEGGELWLGGGASTLGGGSGSFNIGGASLYPFSTGYSISHLVSPRFSGVGGLTRLRSEGSSFTNYISAFLGPGGFVKEGEDTLYISGGRHTFSGPVIISNGTVNVSVAMHGGNDVLVAGGALNLLPGASAFYSALTVTGGVCQVHSNSVLALKSADFWARVGGSGTFRLLDGAKMLRLDVSGTGTLDLAGGTATVYRVRIGGTELTNGYYTAEDSASITGPGLLYVSFQNAGRSVFDTFSRPDGPAVDDSLGRTEEPGGTDWSEFLPYLGIGNTASIVNNELRIGIGTSDPMIAVAAASWPNGDFTTRMRFNRVGAAGATVKNASGLILRRNVTMRTGVGSTDFIGAVHVQMTAAGGLFLREHFDQNRYNKNPFTGGDYVTYGAAGSLPTTINGLPFDADGDGRLGDDESFELRAILSGNRLQVLVNGEPVAANNGFAAVSASEENGAGFWINRLSSANVETHDSYHDSFSVSNLPFVIRHINDFEPNIAAALPRENWTLYGTSDLVQMGPVTETVGGEEVKAWRVDDNGGLKHYLTALSDAEVAAANAYGWRLKMRLRVVDNSDALDGSVSAQIATAPNLYNISFGSDAAGNAKVQVTNGSVHTIPGGSVYHLYELEYDPVSGTASLKCDGALLQAGLVKSSNTMERVLWGANQTTSTGCGHYELVQFSILWPEPPPAPMPPPPPPPPGTVILLR